MSNFIIIDLLLFDLKGNALCRQPLLAPRVAIWEAWCLHFNIMGDHSGTSGAPWGAILAPRDHPGGPHEEAPRGCGATLEGHHFEMENLIHYWEILGPIHNSLHCSAVDSECALPDWLEYTLIRARGGSASSAGRDSITQ